jgi:hypothetical protein
MIHDSFRPPRQIIFDEIKGACIDMWNTYDNTWGFVDEKLALVEQIHNHGGDVMLLLNMFNPNMKEFIIKNLSPDAKDYINYYNIKHEEQGIDPERDN